MSIIGSFFASLFGSSKSGLTPASGGGTTNFLRADATWAVPPGTGGGGTVTAVTGAAPITSTGGTTPAIGCPTVTSVSAGLAPSSGGGTTNFLRADGTWTAPPGGGGTVTAVTGTAPITSSGGTTPAIGCPNVTSGAGGLAPASGGGTTNFLRADGTWAAPAGTGAFTQIGQVVVGAGGQASVTFSAIPGTFTNLMLKYIARSSTNSSNDNIICNFNADSTPSHYAWNFFVAGTSTTTGSINPCNSGSQSALGQVPAATSQANAFASVTIDILNYANTFSFKNGASVISYRTGVSGADVQSIFLMGIEWFSTAAITSITLTPLSAANFVQNSTFTLYGLQ
jgi:hypothetical protein